MRQQIDQIIVQRKKKVEGIKSKKEEIQALKKALVDSVGEMAGKIHSINDPNLRAKYADVYATVNIVEIRKMIDQYLKRLDDAIKRFDRDYISIATVGKERQGKSRLLQSVGNLYNDIIPAYDGTSCTGATSIIWNDNSIPKGKVKAVIYFRKQEELVDILSEYIKIIDESYLEVMPFKFDEIPYININALSLKAEFGKAEHTTAIKQISNIVDHFDEIKDLFGSPAMELSDSDMIKRYVAQNNGCMPDDPKVEYYYAYLAVAKADIYCPFLTDTGNVRLVDTIGIGDTKFGIEDAMLDTVDRECDAAIVLTRPISGVQKADIDIYNMLRDKFENRDTSKWLFYFVNLFKGEFGNEKVVDQFHDDIVEGNWAVADCRIVDASNQDAVRDDFVIPMLQKLAANMEEIDKAYLAEVEELENELKFNVQRFVNELPESDAMSMDSVLGLQAAEKGRACFEKMAGDLKMVVNHWSKQKDQPNYTLWNSVNGILNDLDKIIPSEEEIDRINRNNGHMLGIDIWATMLHHIRNTITDRFIVIDDAFETDTLEFKKSLIETLYRELKKLSAAYSEEDEIDTVEMIEWLKVMSEEVLTDEKFAQIRKGFEFLYKFEFNTRAQLIQEVRRLMYIINPICTEYAQPTYGFPNFDCGKSIHFYLTSRMSVIEDELRYHLSKLYRTPNMAFYAAAEEFYDRLIFASDLTEEGKVVRMADVWGDLFQQYASVIWNQNTQDYTTVQKFVNIYSDMIKTVKDFSGNSSEI